MKWRTASGVWSINVDKQTVPIQKCTHLPWHKTFGLNVYMNGGLVANKTNSKTFNFVFDSNVSRLFFGGYAWFSEDFCPYSHFTLDEVMIWSEIKNDYFIKMVYYN